MNILRQPVPWVYSEVARYLGAADEVLDIGTGGGERFSNLAGLFGRGLGIDVDPEMVQQAQRASAAPNVEFRVGSARLEGMTATFDLVLNRHARSGCRRSPGISSPAVTSSPSRWASGTWPQSRPLGQSEGTPVIGKKEIARSGPRLLAFGEYDVEYVVCDIESLVFSLGALDVLHTGTDGSAALASAATLNKILAGHTDHRGFVTNEHRYLTVAQQPG
jgi:SAM-dependent methyltransferase